MRSTIRAMAPTRTGPLNGQAPVIITALVILITIGAAWGTTQQRLSGVEESVRELTSECSTIGKDVAFIKGRLEKGFP